MTLWSFVFDKSRFNLSSRERLLLQISAASDKINKLLFVFCFALNVIFTADTLKFLVYLFGLAAICFVYHGEGVLNAQG